MDFKFERSRIDKIPREKIVAELVNVAKIYNFTRFTSKEFLKSASIGHQTVFREFGTWDKAMEYLSDALKEKGIVLKQRAKPKRKDAYTKKQLFDEMQRIWGQLGHRPSKDEWEQSNPHINYNTIRRHFSGWTNACKEFIEYITGETLPEKSSSTVSAFAENENKSQIKPENYRTIPLGIRLKILARDNFRCVLCGRSPATDIGTKLHIDHIVPFSKGGKSTEDNLQTLCDACNLGKSNRDIVPNS